VALPELEELCPACGYRQLFEGSAAGFCGACDPVGQDNDVDEVEAKRAEKRERGRAAVQRHRERKRSA
jgi:uncharacterized Zn finger protein (UPF0148 family)